MPKRLKISQRAFVGEGVGVPLGHDDHGLAGFAEGAEFGFLLGARGKPAGVDLVVFGVRGAGVGGEAEELGVVEFAGLGFALEFGVLGEGLGANVGGKELGMALFEAEVGGGVVAVEGVGVVGDLLAEGDHAGLVGGCGIEGLGEGREPVEAPLERADDAVGVAGGEGGLPGKHPFCVKAERA